MKKKYTQVDVKKTGENIKFYMEKAKVSVPRLAREVDATPNAISNYRNGYNLPDTEHMYKLCKFLNVDIKDIIVEKEVGKNNEKV